MTARQICNVVWSWRVEKCEDEKDLAALEDEIYRPLEADRPQRHDQRLAALEALPVQPTVVYQ